MANPPKAKGTRAETELLRILIAEGLDFVKTENGARWDLEHRTPSNPPFPVLAVRPDYGEWLVTMRLKDFLHLVKGNYVNKRLRVEVKRYARYATHTIFVKKFGRST